MVMHDSDFMITCQRGLNALGKSWVTVVSCLIIVLISIKIGLQLELAFLLAGVLAVLSGLTVMPAAFFMILTAAQIMLFLEFNTGLLFKLRGAEIYSGDMAIAGIFIYCSVIFFSSKRSVLFRTRSAKLFFLFFLIGSIAILRGFSKYHFSAVGEGRWYTMLLLYYFCLLAVMKRPEDVLRWGKFAIYGAIPAMIILRRIFFDPQMHTTTDWRVEYRFVNSTETLIFAIVIISILILLIESATRNKMFLLFLILSGFGLILYLQHRSVWVSSAVGLTVVGYIYRKKLVNIKRLFLVGSLVFIIVGMAVLVGKSSLTESLSRSIGFISNPQSDSTGSWRLLAWGQQINIFLENPVFGEGLGHYTEWFDGGEWTSVPVHNGYIMYLSKFGLLGALVLVTGLIFWFRETSKALDAIVNTDMRILLISLRVGILMHLAYIFFYDFTVFFWMMLAAGIVVSSGKIYGVSAEA